MAEQRDYEQLDAAILVAIGDGKATVYRIYTSYEVARVLAADLVKKRIQSLKRAGKIRRDNTFTNCWVRATEVPNG